MNILLGSLTSTTRNSVQKSERSEVKGWYGRKSYVRGHDPPSLHEDFYMINCSYLNHSSHHIVFYLISNLYFYFNFLINKPLNKLIRVSLNRLIHISYLIKSYSACAKVWKMYLDTNHSIYFHTIRLQMYQKTPKRSLQTYYSPFSTLPLTQNNTLHFQVNYSHFSGSGISLDWLTFFSIINFPLTIFLSNTKYLSPKMNNFHCILRSTHFKVLFVIFCALQAPHLPQQISPLPAVYWVCSFQVPHLAPSFPINSAK